MKLNESNKEVKYKKKRIYVNSNSGPFGCKLCTKTTWLVSSTVRNVSLSVLVQQNFRKTYGKYRKSTEGKNILCTNREIKHLCQVNKIGQYALFINLKMISLQKHLEADEKDRFQLLLTSPLLNKVHITCPLTDKS